MALFEFPFDGLTGGIVAKYAYWFGDKIFNGKQIVGTLRMSCVRPCGCFVIETSLGERTEHSVG
jgi:hypothetical protein